MRPAGEVVLTFLLIAIQASPVLPADAPETLPWKVNKPIVSIKKELYIEHPRPKAAAIAWDGYVGPKLERMEYRGVEAVDDAPEDNRYRLSIDNGRTWSHFQPADLPPGAEGIGGGPVVFDPAAGVLVRIGMRQLFSGSQANHFVYSQYSRDYGVHWTAPRQLRYEPGDDFDAHNPLKPGFLLRNQAYRGSTILLLSNGTLVHAAGLANAPHDPDNDTRPYRMGGLCFVGKWDPAAKDYRWRAGQRVSISPDVSSRGLMEPDLAELTDKRLLVVWRGSDSKVAGRKWFSISSDGGLTLSEPTEWKYEDGSRFYSPSSWHLFLRHSVTGRLYWFGNICAEPPDGNWPRFPLIIAEVDEKRAALKRSTVTAIDDARPGQSPRLQFSNFSLLEDREAHNIEMLLTIYSEDPSDWRNADCYKYVLRLR